MRNLGCGFVSFTDQQSCENAINWHHNKTTLPNAKNALQIRYLKHQIRNFLSTAHINISPYMIKTMLMCSCLCLSRTFPCSYSHASRQASGGGGLAPPPAPPSFTSQRKNLKRVDKQRGNESRREEGKKRRVN